MDNIKLQFLLEDLPAFLQKLPADAKGKWGVMNGQQMVEHFTDMTLVAAGKIHLQLYTPSERLIKMREFLFSDTPFKENTKNPLLSDVPSPLRLPDMSTAISELQRALQAFVEAYEFDPSREIINPFFGPLDYSGQIQLLFKHAQHHLRQFGLI
jgi:DinB superfamily